MFKVFSFCLIHLSFTIAFAQFGDSAASDEFDLTEPAFEVNSSQEDLSEIEDPLAKPSVGSRAQQTENLQRENSEQIENPNNFSEEDQNQKVRVQRQSRSSLQDSTQDSNLVEVRSSRSIFLPYKERQNTWGFNFSLGAEFVTFPNLVSQFDTNTFQDLFGSEPLMMPSFELGPRYNTRIGSIGLMFGFASLSASDDRIQVKAEVDITRYTATLTYYLDTIWSEPYFVPYASVGAWQSEYSERTEDEPDTSAHYSTDIGYHWRIGGLIGLDWLEPKTALGTRRSLGLQGTFLNIYATSSYMAESDPDPDLQNEMDLGASLILEF